LELGVARGGEEVSPFEGMAEERSEERGGIGEGEIFGEISSGVAPDRGEMGTGAEVNDSSVEVTEAGFWATVLAEG
jgi:hypothetical protein